MDPADLTMAALVVVVATCILTAAATMHVLRGLERRIIRILEELEERRGPRG